MGFPTTPATTQALIADSRKSALEKVERLYAAEIDFHTAAAESVRLAKSAVTDFRIEELRGRLNELIEGNQFSLGKFLVDLMLQIAFGPVLGSVMGRAVGKQMSAIIYWRKEIVPLRRLLGRAAKGSITQAEEETLRKTFKAWANRGIQGGRMAELPTYQLSDFQTGVVVDTFEVIAAAIPALSAAASDGNSSLGKLSTALTNPSQDVSKAVGLNAAAIKYVPTILESIDDNADNYLLAQRKTAFEQQRILRAWVAEAETGDALLALHARLDRSLEAFADQVSTTLARRQLRNLSKMLGLLLFKGDPAGWSGIVRHADPAFGVVTHYDMTWPEELQRIVLNNIWIPGTEESYYHRYLKIKQIQLEREAGEGIDERAVGRGDGTPPVHYPSSSERDTPGNLGSRAYTALQSAFWYFQKFMEQFYKDLTSKQYDAMFLEMLQRWGYPVSK